MTEDQLVEIVKALHKAAYEAGTAAFKADLPLYDGVDNLLPSSGTNAIDYSEAGEQTITNVLTNEKVKVTLGEKANRDWTTLTDEQVNALISSDLRYFESKRKINDSYNLSKPKAGVLTVNEATLVPASYVHDDEAWDAANSKWLDWDRATDSDLVSAGGWTSTATKAAALDAKYGSVKDANGEYCNWIYAAYDVNPNRIESAIYYDAATDYFTAIPEEIVSSVRYSVKKNGETSPVNNYYRLTAAELEKGLQSLPAGTYKLETEVLAVDKVIRANRVPVDMEFTFKVGCGQLVISTEADDLKGGSVVRGGTLKELEKVLVKVEGGESAIQPASDTYSLKFSETNTASSVWVDLDKIPFTTDAKEKTLYVKAVANTAGLKDSAVVSVKIKVDPLEHGENDKVSNIVMTHTAEEAGKVVYVGNVAEVNNVKYDYSFERTYGKYTENQKNAAGFVKTDDDDNYIATQKDNTVTYKTEEADTAIDLREYVLNELLYSNGYAVANQNTNLYYTKNKAGNIVLARYADNAKTAFLPQVGGNTAIYDDGDDTNVIDKSLDITGAQAAVVENLDSEGNFTGNAAALARIAQNGNPEATIDYNSRVFDTANNKKNELTYLLTGISLNADVTDNEDGIIATRTVTSGGQSVTRPLVSLTNGALNYSLASGKKTGNAIITITVSRKYYSDITFDVRNIRNWIMCLR